MRPLSDKRQVCVCRWPGIQLPGSKRIGGLKKIGDKNYVFRIGNEYLAGGKVKD